ncbi:zinc ribbon domain-containing protein [Paraburkholderia sp. LEh10]|uniref:zinc ribbon domain-containing protein n=1 Tax=Paraburkholderia sp. LEh10 TaxID=2821353 RepID=UPI001AE33D3D|nr:zinc ribbon domain-containing protein [Paraburkholderia sp. LEh10]MBP0591572.1 zinc ribbon domain-containing protein [Paraburkholderia sp. LEh10]
MSAETTPAQGFPTPCTRCGGVLYQHVEFCPYCGADHPLDRTQRRRAGTQLRAVDPHAPLASVPEESAERPQFASPDIGAAPLDAAQPLWQTAGRWIVTRGIVLLLFILALGYAGYLLLGDNHKQDSGSDETANSAANSANSASTSGGSISPYTPQPARSTPSVNVTTVPAAKTAPVPPIAPPRPRIVQHYRDVPDALRAARTGLAHNNLADAKAALSDALSVEPANSDALQMQADLKDRENRRDVALGVANTCAKDKLWGCVRDRASQALALDVSSADAQALLERVILSTGWKPLTSAATPTPRPSRPAASATVPPSPLTSGMPGSNAAANTATNAATGTAASAVDALDAQMRAIRESGWKHAPTGAAKKQ